MNNQLRTATVLLALASAILVFNLPDVSAHEGHGKHRSGKSVGPRNARPPKTQAELPTTSAAIFLDNLSSQTAVLRRQVELDPACVDWRQRLAELIYVRSQYQVDLAGQQRAIEELTRCIQLDARNADLFVSRAKMQQTLHRFHEAQADLKRAIEIGASEAIVRTVQQELDWNTGNYLRAIRAIRDAADLNPNTQTLARLARLEHDLGKYALSDRRFEQAEDAFSDTNPLILAWLHVQRGVCQFERANFESAVEYFREATNRMPGFLSARSQLAETLYAMGQSKEAVEIYASILSESTNPEFSAALAVIYRQLGQTTRANGLKRKAIKEFKALMRDFPEAMAGHASHFFLTEGNDLKLALELTQQDVELRPNSESYQALALAQLANDRLAEASASLAVALKMPVKSPGLVELQSTLRSRHAHTGN